MSKLKALVMLAVLCPPLAAVADDAWDLASTPDDTIATPNGLVHGATQTHDVQAFTPPDKDWFHVNVRSRQSYEVGVRGSTLYFTAPGFSCNPVTCASLDRVTSDGTVLQGAAIFELDVFADAIRWTAAADGPEYVLVTGPLGTAQFPPTTYDQYTIGMLNTTLFAPRFNNTATQTSILLLQNETLTNATGSIDFWSSDGTLLHGEPFTIAARGVLVLNTSTLAGAAGASGAISISQNAGYAGLTGKVVSVEPATGFTFDTAVTPIPR
jgi:hypothetical protein